VSETKPGRELSGAAQAGPRVFQLYSGAGNRFLVVPGEERERDWSELARALCGRALLDGQRADGLLLVASAEADEDARMILWNADGSRAEACGNGLRCIGLWLHRRGATGRRRVETDAGVREVEVLETAGAAARVRAQMGRAERFRLAAPLPGLAAPPAVGVRLGNPHCVVQVLDERSAPVEALGAALQRHRDFPAGVNVGFLARREDRWHLRVFERGVGETAACGSGACAAAAVVGLEGETIELEMPGGTLRVTLTPGGELELVGEARFHGEVELETDPGGRGVPARR